MSFYINAVHYVSFKKRDVCALAHKVNPNMAQLSRPPLAKATYAQKLILDLR